jgi:hypothetical protein
MRQLHPQRRIRFRKNVKRSRRASRAHC